MIFKGGSALIGAVSAVAVFAAAAGSVLAQSKIDKCAGPFCDASGFTSGAIPKDALPYANPSAAEPSGRAQKTIVSPRVKPAAPNTAPQLSNAQLAPHVENQQTHLLVKWADLQDELKAAQAVMDYIITPTDETFAKAKSAVDAVSTREAARKDALFKKMDELLANPQSPEKTLTPMPASLPSPYLGKPLENSGMGRHWRNQKVYQSVIDDLQKRLEQMKQQFKTDGPAAQTQALYIQFGIQLFPAAKAPVLVQKP